MLLKLYFVDQFNIPLPINLPVHFCILIHSNPSLSFVLLIRNPPSNMHSILLFLGLILANFTAAAPLLSLGTEPSNGTYRTERYKYRRNHCEAKPARLEGPNLCGVECGKAYYKSVAYQYLYLSSQGPDQQPSCENLLDSKKSWRTIEVAKTGKNGDGCRCTFWK